MLVKTPAIVLSSVKYGETSLITKMYTKELGVQSYIVKGILSNSKKNIKVAYFLPLTQLEIVATTSNDEKLKYIREAKIVNNYSSIYSNMTKNSVSFFISEICYLILNEEFKDEKLYDFIQGYINWYDLCDFSANFHLKFLIDLTSFLGFYPDISKIENRLFDLETGVFVNEHNGNLLFSEEETHIFKSLLSYSLSECNSVLMSRNQRNNLLELILKYYKFHYAEFRTPKSWQVLKEIFN